jgi:hypothetical protein
MTRAILLLVDGLRPDVAEAELAAGGLPHLARLVAGGSVTRAVTAFPSTTSVAYLPFLTGCLPGRCNVPSIRWLDRAAYGGRWWRDREAVRSYCGYQAGRLDADIAPEVRTIFDLVPESAVFFSPVTRGLGPGRDPSKGARKFWGALSHYLMWHQPGDDVVAGHLLDWVERDEAWRFLFAQFPAVDGYTHQADPGHPRVRRALRQRKGLAEETLVLVVSDHGATRVRRHLDLAQWFRLRGVPTLAHPELWRRDPRVAVMVAGNGSAMLYARPGVARAERWPLERLRAPEAFGSEGDLVAALLREPGVAFVAGEAAGGGLAVADRRGEARIDARGERAAYRPLTADPLGVGGAFEGDRTDWLDRTFDGPFPDGVVQLLDQFRSPRTGDLVVVAEEGCDFRDRWEVPEHRSGHGSMIRAHMHTPVWANRPGATGPLRTADLFASVLDWLGVAVPAAVDAAPAWLPRTGAELPAGRAG